MSTHLVVECMQEVMRQTGKKIIPISAKTDILKESSLDSLDLALVVIMLEEKTGKDPFAQGFILFRTVEELAKLYD